MFCPATTGSGASVLVTARSAKPTAVVVAWAILFAPDGSVVELAAVAVFVITRPAALELTLTTTVKTAVCPAGTVALEKTIFPVPPTPGEVVSQPVPVVTTAEIKVVFAGTASVTVTPCASEGPLLTKLIV